MAGAMWWRKHTPRECSSLSSDCSLNLQDDTAICTSINLNIPEAQNQQLQLIAQEGRRGSNEALAEPTVLALRTCAGAWTAGRPPTMAAWPVGAGTMEAKLPARGGAAMAASCIARCAPSMYTEAALWRCISSAAEMPAWSHCSCCTCCRWCV
eukprot:scaffold224286_cov24-Tisochrysis_lutea.AAC.3